MKKIHFLLAFLLVQCLCCLYAGTAMSQPITLVTLGDSLTAGDGDSTGNGGYPFRLLSLLTPDYPDSTLSNLAISGDTTRDLINKQLDTAVAQLGAAPAGALKMALVWIGSNDLFGLYASDVCTDYYPDLDTCESVEAGDRRDNINTILERLSATGAQVYIALLDDQTRRPVIADPSLRMDTFPGITDAEVPRMAAQIIHYNDQVKTLAAAHGATTVDFYTTTLFETPATLDSDGNHPNSSGYDVIARIWYQAVTGTAVPDDPDTPDDTTPDNTTPPVIPNPENPPVPEIFSGTSTSSISVTTSQTVTISVSLDAGSMLNTPGDWWLIHVAPDSSVLSLTGDLRWQETLAPVLSMPLVSFQEIPIFSNILTNPGTHFFYFAVDDKADGLLEAPLWFDGFTVQVSEAAPVIPGDDTERLMPGHLHYKGAFQLPDDFNWGALGLTYYPAGDAGTGSLLVTGFQSPSSPEHPFESCWNPEWNCHAYYGQVRIPTPVIDADWENLPRAAILGQMTSFDQGLVTDMEREYVFVSDIAYVPKSGTQTRDKIYGAANFWYAAGTFGEDSFPTIWMADLNGANARGMFHVGPDADPYHGRKTGSYLFSAPQWYADQYLGGRTLVTGRSRGTPADLEPITTNGGSQGPTLFAFHPFASDNPAGNLDARPMLYYRVKFPGCAGPNIGPTDACDYPGFTMCDNWTGGAFVDDGERRAVMLLGYKGLGNNCYGADACNNPCSDGQGYHCNPYERQVVFYDVHDLGAVARQERDPWSILPYTVWRPEEFFIQGHTCWNTGGMTFHPASGRLFMVERGLGEGEANAAVVHVWSVK